jgi:NAD-dependent SIR2 family protein deacetylase
VIEVVDMKHVKCNHCSNEYYIDEVLDGIGFPLGGKQCEVCGETDYLIINDDVKVEYNNDCIEPTQKTEDFICSLMDIKKELLGIIENYIDPYFK